MVLPLKEMLARLHIHSMNPLQTPDKDNQMLF